MKHPYFRAVQGDLNNNDDAEFQIRSRLNGTKEAWTNTNLIYMEEDFFNILSSSNSIIWLTSLSNKRPGASPLEERINQEFSEYLYYVNFDSTINVYKIPKDHFSYNK